VALESLGFGQVYDYAAGKSDWMAAGLPIEGAAARRPTAATVTRREVPTCHLEKSLRAVRKRVRAAGRDACVVINEKRIVMGLLGADQLGRDGDVTAGSAMRPGPSTFRPHVAIEEMAKVMAKRDLPNVPVTTSAGELIGLLVREDVERAVLKRQEAVMKWTGMYLLGFLILIGGLLAALWEVEILATIGTTWTLIGVVIAIGIGIMVSVSSSGTKESIEIDRK
jgi:CBS domain-containing protein